MNENTKVGTAQVDLLLGEISGAMQDLVNNAEDTLWITPGETVFERLWDIYAKYGEEEILKTMFPQCA